MIIYLLYIIARKLLPSAMNGIGSVFGSVLVIIVILIGVGICLSAVTGRDQVGPALDHSHKAVSSGTGWVLSRVFRGFGRLIRLIARSVRNIYLWVFRHLTARGLRAIWAGMLGVLAALIWIAII